MTMNSSGPISLGGPVRGQSIAVEILHPPTNQISLNDTDVRTLALVPSGQITMPTNFYNKAWHATLVDVFMMGGGGLGTSPYGDGGGGGQMKTVLSSSVTPFSTYPITVGGVGSGSSFNGVSAIAGGNGGAAGFDPSHPCGSGNTGACGGAGGGDCWAGGGCPGGSGLYGGSGGSGAGIAHNSAGNGGGGGLGGNGGNAYRSGITNYGGNGGASLASTFTLSTRYYGGGQPGTWWCGSGDPQVNGSWYDSNYGPNTGYGSYSGIVIIRVPDNVLQPTYTGSCTFSQYGGYFWFTYTGTGTITF